MVTEIKKLGYAPETKGVVFDVEEEEKETVVGYHSENLAVAFGFISKEPGSVRRIFVFVVTAILQLNLFLRFLKGRLQIWLSCSSLCLDLES
ncbi:hypothetical protein MKX03_027675 [Papaver bracteatum]|nr:hypothetical protein MKX03_027675 [Papaver bracteatum]